MNPVLGSPMGVSFVKTVKFIFPDELIKRPLLHEMAQMYDIITSIEKAHVGETNGWIIVEVSGTGDELDKALQWVADQGVCVQTLFPNI